MVTYTYDAWGKPLSANAQAGGNTSLDTAKELRTLNPLRYRGYVYDTESGLYYLQSRYYNPELCRFINADETSTLFITPTELTDKNLFAYCDNDPINRKDDGGRLWNFVIGAVVGGLVSGITEYVKTGDLSSAVVAGAVGAVSGAVAASGLNVFVQAGITAAVTFAGDAIGQKKKLCEID